MYRLFLFLIILLFSACGARTVIQCDCAECPRTADNGYSHEDTEPPPRMIYLALGDSVSEGYGIWSPQHRHTAVFFEMLRERGYANEYINLAVSGYTTADLLALLAITEKDVFYYASVITLNIGGNNILAPFWEHLPSTEEIQDIADQTIEFTTEAWELLLEIMDFATEAQETITDILTFVNEIVYFADNFGVRDIFRVNEKIAAIPPVVDTATELMDEVNIFETAINDMLAEASELEVIELFSLFAGTFPPELEAAFRQSIRQFEDEFAQILSILENSAPNAAIIVNTVYNPLPTNVMGLPIAFAEESQRLIREINDIIYTESTARGFIVSDVYANLSERADLMNLSFDIIHPNPSGHYAIANLNFNDLIQGG